MACVYCRDDPAIKPNCYCRVISLIDTHQDGSTSLEWQAEQDAVVKVFAEFRRANKAGDQGRVWALKRALNFPPRRFTAIAQAFGL